MTRAEAREHGRRIRALLAELVIARGWPVKAAAYELGINRKTCEWHVAQLRRRIRTGTDRLLGVETVK
jgi:FixJ family two-component response regulator